MWIWHACLSSVLASQAPCHPTSWADIAEMFILACAVIAVPFALWLLTEWLNSLL